MIQEVEHSKATVATVATGGPSPKKLCDASLRIGEAWVVQDPTKPGTNNFFGVPDFERLEVQDDMPVMMMGVTSESPRLSFMQTARDCRLKVYADAAA